MVTRHKIDFLIHWLHLQLDEYHPSLSPCWAGLRVIVSITPGASLLFPILTGAPQHYPYFTVRELSLGKINNLL